MNRTTHLPALSAQLCSFYLTNSSRVYEQEVHFLAVWHNVHGCIEPSHLSVPTQTNFPMYAVFCKACLDLSCFPLLAFTPLTRWHCKVKAKGDING